MKIDKFCFQNGNGFKLSDIKCNDTLKYSESDRPAVEEEMKGNIEDITKLQDKLCGEHTCHSSYHPGNGCSRQGRNDQTCSKRYQSTGVFSCLFQSSIAGRTGP